MYSIKYLLFTFATFFLVSSCNAINNPKTTTHKVYGNCGMCKKTIEKAVASTKNAKGDWNKDTKILTLTFDSTKSNPDEILKRVGLVGYDNDLFYAPNDTYAKLPKCCQYDRRPKPNQSSKNESKTTTQIDSSKIKSTVSTTSIEPNKAESNELKNVFNAYFDIKNALVKTDGNTASAQAKIILTAISSVKMESLSDKEHTLWMKLMKDIKFDAEHIEETKDASHQRDHFNSLSKNIYALIKVSKQETPTFYQFCPMANDGKGANWLSKENKIMNPYYGSMMLNCGKVVETIK